MPVGRPISDEDVAFYMEQIAKGDSRIQAARKLQERSPQRWAGIKLTSMRTMIGTEIGEREMMEEVSRLASGLPQASEITEAMDTLDVPYADSVVICDAHVPHHDPDLYAKAITIGRQRKIRRMIFGGDTFDLDCFSQYLKLKTAEPDPTVEKVAGMFDAAIDYGFDELCIIMGNHDERLGRKLDLKIGMGWLLSRVKDASSNRAALEKRLLYTERFYMTMTDTPDGITWRITHPDNYRKKRLSTADELAWKKRCHILSAHEHHLGVTISTYGKFYVVNGGCLADPLKTEYIQRRDKVSADWSPGFIVLRNGAPQVFSKTAPDAWWRSELARKV